MRIAAILFGAVVIELFLFALWHDACDEDWVSSVPAWLCMNLVVGAVIALAWGLS